MTSNDADKRAMGVYFMKQNGMNFRVIGKVMEFSPARARQLYLRAIRMLNNGYVYDNH